MELLGLQMAKSLLSVIPKQEVGEEKYVKISEAYLQFFKHIVYWLEFGYSLETKCSL